MKKNQQLLVIGLVCALVSANGFAQAADRATSDDVIFAKPAPAKPAPARPAAKADEPGEPEAPSSAAADAHDYDHCLGLVKEDPQSALDYAQAWQSSNGQISLAARHCAALAMSALGRHHDAAILLSEVALAMNSKPDAPKEARAEAYAQVADAWMLANDAKKALAAIEQALALDPQSDYLMTRANIHALAGNWNDVRIDTGKILAELPTDAEALSLRATAYRNLGALDAALEDANRALEIAPHNLTALLERGRIKAARLDMPGARTDWRQVVQFAREMGREKDPRAVAAQEFLGMGDGTK
ncbi:MAG: tetratricopeptide repeat protein [Parvibaculum sp.]